MSLPIGSATLRVPRHSRLGVPRHSRLGVPRRSRSCFGVIGVVGVVGAAAVGGHRRLRHKPFWQLGDRHVCLLTVREALDSYEPLLCLALIEEGDVAGTGTVLAAKGRRRNQGAVRV